MMVNSQESEIMDNAVQTKPKAKSVVSIWLHPQHAGPRTDPQLPQGPGEGLLHPRGHGLPRHIGRTAMHLTSGADAE